MSNVPVSAGDPVPNDQQKKMEGKRSWADPKVHGFQLDLSRFAFLCIVSPPQDRHAWLWDFKSTY